MTVNSNFPGTRRYFQIATGVVFAGAVAFSSLASAADDSKSAEHPLANAIRYAQSCLKKVEALPGYEASFTKREVVGRSLISQKMKLKIRHDPFSVYLFFENPNNGREVIFVDGRNNGNLLAHDVGLKGLIGTLELSPTGNQAMSENRHPITKAGISNLVTALIAQWELESKYGETDVKYFKDAKLADMTCRVVESSHPRPRNQFKFHKTRLWVDEETGFPVRVQQYGFPVAGGKPPLIEDYTFMDIRTRTDFADRDFDPANPKYNF